MASLAQRNCAFLSFAHEAVLLREATHHTLCSALEIIHCDRLRIAPCSEDSGLVANVSNVCASKTWSESSHPFRYAVDVQLFIQHNGLQMNKEDSFTLSKVRLVNRYLSVKASRPCEGRIKNVRTIRAS